MASCTLHVENVRALYDITFNAIQFRGEVIRRAIGPLTVVIRDMFVKIIGAREWDCITVSWFGSIELPTQYPRGIRVIRVIRISVSVPPSIRQPSPPASRISRPRNSEAKRGILLNPGEPIGQAVGIAAAQIDLRYAQRVRIKPRTSEIINSTSEKPLSISGLPIPDTIVSNVPISSVHPHPR